MSAGDVNRIQPENWNIIQEKSEIGHLKSKLKLEVKNELVSFEQTKRWDLKKSEFSIDHIEHCGSNDAQRNNGSSKYKREEKFCYRYITGLLLPVYTVKHMQEVFRTWFFSEFSAQLECILC